MATALDAAAASGDAEKIQVALLQRVHRIQTGRCFLQTYTVTFKRDDGSDDTLRIYAETEAHAVVVQRAGMPLDTYSADEKKSIRSVIRPTLTDNPPLVIDVAVDGDRLVSAMELIQVLSAIHSAGAIAVSLLPRSKRALAF